MRTTLIYLLLILVLSLEIFFAHDSYKNSSNFINIQKEISKESGLDESINKKFDEIFEKISFGIYDKYSKESKNSKKLEIDAKSYYQNSIKSAYYYFGTVFIFLVLFYFMDREFFIILLSTTSIVSLFFALISPLLTIVVYQNIPVVGDVIFSFKSKSILNSIGEIYENSNYMVAFLILLFSVIIPLFKSLILLLYGFLKEYNRGRKIIDFVHKIGKWSMADVFVVSMLLVFFSTNQDIHTLLKMQIGIYFFISYVMLSMFASSFISRKV